MIECYKVVDACDGAYYSSQVIQKPYALKYEIDSVTIPLIGKIFVYKSLADAKRNYGYNEAVLRCECSELTSKTHRLHLYKLWPDGLIEAFWLGVRLDPNALIFMSDDAWLTDWVKPLEVMSSC